MSHPMMMPTGAMAMPSQQYQNQTLYIGNLDKTVTENLIFDRFSKYGKITRFQIMRDKVRNESRGFAFIEYANVKDAEAAKNQLNNEKLQTRYIRVMWKGDHKKAQTDANVFVREIDPRLNQNEVEGIFQRFGPVLSTYLSVNEKGDSNRYAYIQYRSPDDAKKCLEQAKDGQLQVGESPVSVEVFKNKAEREEIKSQNQRNIYVRDLPESIVEEDLHKAFGHKIKSMILNLNNETKTKFALIAFNTRAEAEEIINKFNNATDTFKDQSKPLFLTWHKNKNQLKEERRKIRETDRDLTLYMRNLLPEITKVQIENVLKTLGATVQWINLKPFEATESPNSTVKYKTNYAFIKMTTKEYVQTILGKKDDKEICELFIKGKPFIDIAMPKTDRERMKQIQHRNRAPFNHPMGGGQQYFQHHMQPRFPQMPFFPPAMQWQMPGGGHQMRPQGGFQGGRGGPGGMRPGGMGRGGPRGGGMGMGRGGPRGGMGGPHQGYGQRQQMGGHHMGHMNQGGPQQMRGPPQGQMQTHQPPQPKVEPPQPKKIDLATIRGNWENFKALKAEDKRNVLGEFLYPRVEKITGRTLAPKITGMLVDFEVMTEEEIVEAIEDENTLKQRIQEAREALDEAEGGAEGGQ
jgi:RNA recognition motif-containing protein